MTLYLTTLAIPELRGLASRDRRLVIRHCQFRPLRHWQVWAGMGMLAVMMVAGGVLGRSLAGLWLGDAPAAGFSAKWAVELGSVLLAGAVGGLAMMQGYIHAARPALARARRQVCLDCGYDLIGTFEVGHSRCPECGAAGKDFQTQRKRLAPALATTPKATTIRSNAA